ncbi:TPA: LuxR C-terminal-related transcriptional regulator [Enterobacter roggenkampii]
MFYYYMDDLYFEVGVRMMANKLPEIKSNVVFIEGLRNLKYLSEASGAFFFVFLEGGGYSLRDDVFCMSKKIKFDVFSKALLKRNGIGRIKEKQLEVLKLEIEGFSIVEISKKTGITRKNVYNCRAALIKRLELKNRFCLRNVTIIK